MLSLRTIRRLCSLPDYIASTSAPALVTDRVLNQKPLEEPALIKLKAEKDPDKLFSLFKANSLNRVVVENRFAFEDTVSRLAGAGRFDYIEDLLEYQKRLPQGRREGFIVRLIMLYGKAGMTKHAVDTFYDMHLYRCKRTVKSLNAVLKVLSATSDLEAIESLLYVATDKFEIELDVFTMNIMIKAFCEIGILEKAYITMVHMRKSGITPDVVTYTTLISAFYKHRRVEIANGLWNLMVCKGCLPTLATFNVRIQHLVNTRQAWQANGVVRLMQKLGISPDEVSYNLVIKGLCKAGHFEMAKIVYSALRRKGHKPNIKIYQTMIHYMLKGGNLDFAYRMCKDCMRKNWFPNVHTIYMLLDGLTKNGQLGKANMIMSLVQRRVPPFSSDQMTFLQSTLSRHDGNT